ncbi:MAG: hypothetical protein QM529_06575 [Hydrotalea sp.]|nr:hypothetical protein [Hydrotalea sp.]
MKKTLLLSAIILLATGCASNLTSKQQAVKACNDDPTLKQYSADSKKGLPPYNCASLRQGQKLKNEVDTTKKVPLGS